MGSAAEAMDRVRAEAQGRVEIQPQWQGAEAKSSEGQWAVRAEALMQSVVDS